MTKADVFLIISQIYIVAVNKEKKVLLAILGSIWLILSCIAWSTTQ